MADDDEFQTRGRKRRSPAMACGLGASVLWFVPCSTYVRKVTGREMWQKVCRRHCVVTSENRDCH